MVGAERFELSTSWSQTRRSTRLSYTPPTGPRWDAGGQVLSMTRNSRNGESGQAAVVACYFLMHRDLDENPRP